MRQMRGVSLGALALAIAATATFAADTSANARTARHHGASYYAAHHASPRWHGAYGAYMVAPPAAYFAIPRSIYADPSYPGYGYGYGDNSNNYTN